jgi:DNA processing protein
MLSRRGGRTDIRLCTEAEAEGELELAESLGASLVAIGEPGYPPALAQVDSPPPLLYAKGRFELADMPVVAIVGARNGSAVGQKFTRQLATDLAFEGFGFPDHRLLRRRARPGGVCRSGQPARSAFCRHQ